MGYFTQLPLRGSDTAILARSARVTGNLAVAFSTETPDSRGGSEALSDDLEDNRSYSLEEYVKIKKQKTGV
jgi:hypothetical protein